MSISTNSFNSALGENNFIAMHNTTNAICPAISDALEKNEQLAEDAKKGSAIAMQKLEEMWKKGRLSDDGLHYLKRLAYLTPLNLAASIVFRGAQYPTIRISRSMPSPSLSEYPANNVAQDAVKSQEEPWLLALKAIPPSLAALALCSFLISRGYLGPVWTALRGVAVAPVLPVPALPLIAQRPQEAAPAA